jgi:hypothetical protein
MAQVGVDGNMDVAAEVRFILLKYVVLSMRHKHCVAEFVVALAIDPPR